VLPAYLRARNLPAFAGRLSTAEYGIFMNPYQRLADGSMRAFCS
jgi:hypothetical protein